MLLLVAESLPAQYRPMSIDSANWIVFEGVTPDDGRVYTIIGDTIIDDVSYKKLYVRTLYTTASTPREVNIPYVVGSPQLRGFLRDDLERNSVYGRIFTLLDGEPTLSQDTLIHNFGASVGDTIFGFDYGDEIVVEDTSTVLKFGELRKTLTGQFADTLIEGIGSASYGPIGARNVLLTEGYYDLIDYCVGSFPECGIDRLVSLDRNMKVVVMSAYPIPATDHLTIEYDEQRNSQPSAISIQAINGRELIRIASSRVMLEPGKFRLSVDSLPNGTYILKAYFNNEVGIIKVVKI